MTQWRILVVDDSKLARMAMSGVLAQVTGDSRAPAEAVSGEQALDLLATRNHGPDPVDVVFMDFNMAGMNGLDAAHRMRKTYPDMAIALVSANAQDAVIEEASGLGVAFIEKPVRLRDVESFLRRLGG